MVQRLVSLSAGLFLAGLIAYLLRVPGLEWPAVFLSVVLLEMIAAAFVVLIRSGAVVERGSPIDYRPPDGVVPIVGLKGILGTPNEVNPAIRAYVGEDPVTGPLPIAMPSRGQGSLLGRVGVFSLFVGRDGSTWSDREVAEAYQALGKMGRWVEQEAARWGAPVNLELIDAYFLGDDPAEESVVLAPALDPFRTVVDEADADVLGIASASRAAARLGFADLANLIGTIDPRADHDLTVWFVHLLRAGRSSAVGNDQFGFPSVGIALCYARDSASSEPLGGRPYVDPTTLAHEFLHLFGATDKYGTPLASFPPRSVSPRDIMRLGVERLGQLRIDPLTAVEIGWVDPREVSQQDRPASESV
jgi:hypothetical protein